MVDHIGFKEFVGSLQPLFKLILRNTLKSDILKIYYNEREKALKMTDKNGSKMTITTDTDRKSVVRERVSPYV